MRYILLYTNILQLFIIAPFYILLYFRDLQLHTITRSLSKWQKATVQLTPVMTYEKLQSARVSVCVGDYGHIKRWILKFLMPISVLVLVCWSHSPHYIQVKWSEAA